MPNSNRVSIFVNSMEPNLRTAQYIVPPTLLSLPVRGEGDNISGCSAALDSLYLGKRERNTNDCARYRFKAVDAIYSNI